MHSWCRSTCTWQIWIPRFFFILPSSDLVHQCHCVGEHGFGLYIHLPEQRICSKRSVVHEDFPEISVCIILIALFLGWHLLQKICRPRRFARNLCVYSLNCFALGLFSFSVQAPLEALSILRFLRLHSRSKLTHANSAGFPITSSEASSQNILLELPSLAPPRGLQTDRTPKRSRVEDGTDSTRHTIKGEDKVLSSRQVVSVSQSQSGNDS